MQFEAFKSGVLDVRTEDDPKLWASGYDIPAKRDGRILTREIETGLPAGMSALAFNTRRRCSRIRASGAVCCCSLISNG